MARESYRPTQARVRSRWPRVAVQSQLAGIQWDSPGLDSVRSDPAPSNPVARTVHRLFSLPPRVRMTEAGRRPPDEAPEQRAIHARTARACHRQGQSPEGRLALDRAVQLESAVTHI